jgi:hypothetical protein
MTACHQLPREEGVIIEPPEASLLPRLGVWIMPNNHLPGVLEDFLKLLVPENDGLFAHAVRSVDGIGPDLCLFRPVDRPKVDIHTWLAWQAAPGKPLGQAITMEVLKVTSPICQAVVQWLCRLYLLPAPQRSGQAI